MPVTAEKITGTDVTEEITVTTGITAETETSAAMTENRENVPAWDALRADRIVRQEMRMAVRRETVMVRIVR